MKAIISTRFSKCSLVRQFYKSVLYVNYSYGEKYVQINGKWINLVVNKITKGTIVFILTLKVWNTQ